MFISIPEEFLVETNFEDLNNNFRNHKKTIKQNHKCNIYKEIDEMYVLESIKNTAIDKDNINKFNFESIDEEFIRETWAK